MAFNPLTTGHRRWAAAKLVKVHPPAGRPDGLIHAYFGTDLNRVWQVIEQDLPDLKRQISQVLADM